MKFAPVDQDRFGESEGNCLAACVASLIGRPLDEVTEAIGNGKGGEYVNGVWTGGKHWFDRLTDVLNGWGYSISYDTAEIPQGYSIASGESPRGLYHATVAHNGEIIHDPHPSRAGLLAIESHITIKPLVHLAAPTRTARTWE